MIELVLAALLQVATITGDASTTSSTENGGTTTTTTTTTAPADGGTGNWDDGN